MSFFDIFIPAASALLAGVGGVLLGKHLKGKPPAPDSAWDKIDADAKAKRDARTK